jgi:hypothetical protein
VKLPDRAALGAVLAHVGRAAATEQRLYLVAGTSLLAAGARPFVPRLELAGDRGGSLEPLARAAAAVHGVELVWESPADVIPLPAGWEARALPAPADLSAGPLTVCHFDPYSVALRLIARGDEPDYLAVVDSVRLGWVDRVKLEQLHLEVVPHFTAQSLAQDPAEFRRKFRGLRQVLIRDEDRSRGAEHEAPVAARMT